MTKPIDVADYKGGEVDDNLFEKALFFYIQQETADEGAGAAAKAILRQYGEQIRPQTLGYMQKIFYATLLKYSKTPVQRSVLYHALKWAWNGVGPWRA